MPNDDPSPLQQIPPTFYFGLLCIVIAASIRYDCYRVLGKHFTYEVTMLKDHHLVTTGPYSIVRHPRSWMRESKFLHTAPGKLITAAWFLLYLRIIVSLLLRVETEDELLRRQFGKEWNEWERRVPWKLVPGMMIKIIGCNIHEKSPHFEQK
ncbi:hypothetical protein K435DRAFT_823485 [Dendrothele bispora CBS 962.96]|uniref:Uncharacterized protein n=1 Tax=Dendrothele bispora (strain CBS 962.96) TaxID=1314807 RepID=A0A4V4HBX7_DENBC|nr:hypothetical protein K435DRAFT_823485 [Dendrothele bispora CBS 962.96]